MKVSLNGKIVEEGEASLSIVDKAVWYSFGVYETVKVVQGKVLFVPQHVARLYASAKVVGIDIGTDSSQVESWILEYVRECNLSDHLIKMCVYGATSEGESPRLYIFALGLTFHPRVSYSKGVSAVLFEGERFLPRAKTLSSLQAYLAHTHARAKGAFEALMVDREGTIREGASCNVFVVKDGQVITPPDEYVLAGVTREYVIAAIADAGLSLSRERIPSESLFLSCEELFLTGTVINVMPVVQVDGKPIGDGVVGPVTAKIMEAYRLRVKKMYNE